MERSWSAYDERMWLDGDDVGFDTVGTPMDQEWSISLAKFLHPTEGQVARAQAVRGFGEEGLRELLARVGGPTLEDYAAGTAPVPPVWLSRARRGPTERAIALMCDVIARRGWPFPSFRAASRSTGVEIDHAICTTETWTYAGSRGEVEAEVRAETAFWNPHTPASESVRLRVKGPEGWLVVETAPPWTTWRAWGEGRIVEEAWLAARIEGTLVWEVG